MTNPQDTAVHILKTALEALVPEEMEDNILNHNASVMRAEIKEKIASLDLPALIEEIQKALQG